MTVYENEQFIKNLTETPIDHNATSITFVRINKFVQERGIYKAFLPEYAWVTWRREEIAEYARKKGLKMVDINDAFGNEEIWLHA